MLRLILKLYKSTGTSMGTVKIEQKIKRMNIKTALKQYENSQIKPNKLCYRTKI